MEQVYYIETNGRGVKSDEISREIVDTIAQAALKDGKTAISYMSYGDDPVRVGIPMKAFAAVGPNWEAMEGEVARYNPDQVNVSFILDPTLSKGVERWGNMGRRSVLEKLVPKALVIVNTMMTPEEYLKYLPKSDIEYELVTVDAGDIEKPDVLQVLGAFSKESSIVSESSLREILDEKYHNLENFDEGFKGTKKITVKIGSGGKPEFPAPPKLPNASEMPIAVVIPAVPKGGRNPGYKTASSRTYKPEINYDQCVRCRTCWIFCPDGAIDMNEEGYPSLNYEYCTGCNICKNNCPVDAYDIKLELEMEA